MKVSSQVVDFSNNFLLLRKFRTEKITVTPPTCDCDEPLKGVYHAEANPRFQVILLCGCYYVDIVMWILLCGYYYVDIIMWILLCGY